jgi:uncharacterized cupin superfamily protein
MVPEARLGKTDLGLLSAGPGWFVLNAREAQWRRRGMGGYSTTFTGFTDEDCETHFGKLGVNLFVLGPGESIGLYHWEADVEGFLVLAGEALLIVEGQERPLRQWDYLHCPPGTRHIVLGAGEGRCVVLGLGTREHIDEDCMGGGYVVDDVARRHGVSVDEDVSDANVAYAAYPESQPTAYERGWLPGG